MPLDSLNQDLHECVGRHANLTAHLLDGHPKKISKHTSNHLGAAYIRIWNPDLGPNAGAPLGRRIIQDSEQIVNKTYLQIFNRPGHVLDTAAYTGRRAKEQQEQYTRPWGGKRIKGERLVRTYWVHAMVKQYEASINDACQRSFEVGNE